MIGKYRLQKLSQYSSNWRPWRSAVQNSSFYCLLLFIASLTLLPVDNCVLLPPTLWLFVRQRLVTVGERAFSVSAAYVLNKLSGDIHCGYCFGILGRCTKRLAMQTKAVDSVLLICSHTQLHRRLTKSTKTYVIATCISLFWKPIPFDIPVRCRAVVWSNCWAITYSARCHGAMWCLLIVLYADNVLRDSRIAKLYNSLSLL